MRFANRAGIHSCVNEVPVIAVDGLVCARVVAGYASTIEIPALSIAPGTVTLLTGPARCGKNLLLRVLGLLEGPDSGEVTFEEIGRAHV